MSRSVCVRVYVCIQLHQVFVSCDMIKGLHADLSVSVLKRNSGHRVSQPLLGCVSTLSESAASKRYTAGHESVG